MNPRLGLLFGGLLTLIACSPPKLSSMQPGATPEINSSEGGMWMQMEQVEHQIMTSGLRQPGPLEDYVRAVACRVAAEYCPDIRVYLLDVPEFNASMAPNGSMIVWTGLLLRVANEAQLATVLGHEIAHYRRRHSLARWIELKNTVNALTLIQFATLFGGVANVGDLSQLGAMAYLAANSRDQESEADDQGVRAIADAGYDPREAAKIWRGLIEENEESDDPRPLPFFASHPAEKNRAEVLTTSAQFLYDPHKSTDLGIAEFAANVLTQREALLRAELKQRRFKRSQVLLTRLIAEGQQSGLLHYYQGELYRLRREDGDDKLALAAYRKALDFEDAPALAHRSIGLLLWGKGDTEAARDAFRAYLAAAPKAEDGAMIQSYLAAGPDTQQVSP